MREHFHHDIVSAGYIVAVAVVGINLLRLLSAMLMARGIGAGKTVAGLVAFP